MHGTCLLMSFFGRDFYAFFLQKHLPAWKFGMTEESQFEWHHKSRCHKSISTLKTVHKTCVAHTLANVNERYLLWRDFHLTSLSMTFILIPEHALSNERTLGEFWTSSPGWTVPRAEELCKNAAGSQNVHEFQLTSWSLTSTGQILCYTGVIKWTI